MDMLFAIVKEKNWEKNSRKLMMSLVEYDMYLRLLYFQLFGKKSRMGNRLLEFGEIRLVINQSVVPVELES